MASETDSLFLEASSSVCIDKTIIPSERNRQLELSNTVESDNYSERPLTSEGGRHHILSPDLPGRPQVPPVTAPWPWNPHHVLGT